MGSSSLSSTLIYASYLTGPPHTHIHRPGEGLRHDPFPVPQTLEPCASTFCKLIHTPPPPPALHYPHPHLHHPPKPTHLSPTYIPWCMVNFKTLSAFSCLSIYPPGLSFVSFVRGSLFYLQLFLRVILVLAGLSGFFPPPPNGRNARLQVLTKISKGLDSHGPLLLSISIFDSRDRTSNGICSLCVGDHQLPSPRQTYNVCCPPGSF